MSSIKLGGEKVSKSNVASSTAMPKCRVGDTTRPFRILVALLPLFVSLVTLGVMAPGATAHPVAVAAPLIIGSTSQPIDYEIVFNKTGETFQVQCLNLQNTINCECSRVFTIYGTLKTNIRY